MPEFGKGLFLTALFFIGAVCGWFLYHKVYIPRFGRIKAVLFDHIDDYEEYVIDTIVRGMI